MKHGLEEAAAALGVGLDDEVARRLRAFELMLIGRAVELGLVAPSDRGRIRERHVLDCIRAVPVVVSGEVVYDLGSGAGLPGVVVAIARPDVTVRLVERRVKRVAFLELAIDELGLTNATVVAARVEDLTQPADVCLARAFAPLAQTWALARPILRPGGRLVFFAGRTLDPAGIPENGAIEAVLETSLLESSGPLVIMTRQ